jgi:uncharacterized protein YggE
MFDPDAQHELSRPDVLVISTRHEEDVAADHAYLLVTVEGSSLVTGRAALKKAKEVSALVEELERSGPIPTLGRHSMAMGAPRGRSTPVELGFELGNEKRMGVEVTIEYRVEGFSPPVARGS